MFPVWTGTADATFRRVRICAPLANQPSCGRAPVGAIMSTRDDRRWRHEFDVGGYRSKREPRSGAHAAAGPLPSRVTFNRLELNRILNLYGRMVADGEWRDYAIDFLRDRAVFSVFRRASEVPIYRIEKDPRLARKQGMYSVISATGLILRRGHELDRVLLVIDRKLAVV